jgi:hypothetical protein
LSRSLCGSYIVPVWALCPFFLTVVPDSGLTPLAGAGCLAWGFPGVRLAFGQAGVSCQGAGAWWPGSCWPCHAGRVAGVVAGAAGLRGCGGLPVPGCPSSYGFCQIAFHLTGSGRRPRLKAGAWGSALLTQPP